MPVIETCFGMAGKIESPFAMANGFDRGAINQLIDRGFNFCVSMSLIVIKEHDDAVILAKVRVTIS